MRKTAGIVLGWGVRPCRTWVFLVEEIENPLNGEFNDRLSPQRGGRHSRRRFHWDDSPDCGYGTIVTESLGMNGVLHKMFTT